MRNVHLLVVTHGMWGQPSHVTTIAQIIKEVHAEYAAAKHPEPAIDLDVLLPETNRELHTYDGVDWCAERVVKEVRPELEADGTARVTRFSACGYSLGGLVARYTVGILYAQDFFRDIEPVNFTTFASPHIGILDYGTLWTRTMEFVGTRLLSRTGEQFFAKDKWSPDGQSLLLAMSDREKIFYKAMSSFPNLRIYANALKDRSVPFVTAYITTHDPFAGYPDNGLTVKYDPKYHPVISSWTPASTPPAPPPPAPLYKRITSFPLPPVLNRGWPWNFFVYLALPLLIPLFVSMVLVRFSLATRGSRRRIKLLESEVPTETRLGRLLREFDQEMGRTVVDMVEDETGPREQGPAEVYASRAGSPGAQEKNQEVEEPAEVYTGAAQPILSAQQHQMVKNLNQIKHLRKHIVFISNYMNSHAIIVCRDPVNFPVHLEGKAVLRHWADRFVF
ncbi:DUF676-domain-containing protein [Exidia glandulosa HHB12029]|uniref:DUF676-domain-containing protein n=1 Tax=Exidia glandulosa HHB12029 TaxID=1314781 RepID=A0A166N264_EXIGL|nr:DUF676-domain-containing protein [Exidia glandulosa HHB12029]